MHRVASFMVAVMSVALLGKPVVAEEQPARVRFGETVSLNHLGLYVAMGLDLFSKYSIQVERVSMGGGANVANALVTGDLDFGSLSTINVARLVAQGRPVRIVASQYEMEIWALLLNPQLRSRVTKLSDIRGLTVGVSAIGSGSWGFANLVAKSQGMDPSRDIRIVPLGNIFALLSGLRSGRVDSIVTWEPGTSEAVMRGTGYPLLDLQDEAQHLQFMGAPRSLVEVIAVRDELAQARPELVRKVVQVLNEAYSWIHGHSAEEVTALVGTVLKDVDPQVLLQAVRRSIPGVPENASIRRATYEVAVRKLVEGGALPRYVEFAEAVNCSFAGCLP